MEPDPIVVRPMQWSALADLGDTPPLDRDDHACLAELAAVLKRHGKLDRFAIHLAHRHFVLQPEEVLIERPDPDGRTQHVSIGRLGDTAGAIPTTWLFDHAAPLNMSAAVYCVCMEDPIKPNGCVRHGKSGSPAPVTEKDDNARQKRISEDKGQYDRGFPVGGHGGREADE